MTEEQIKIRVFATSTAQSQEYYYVKGFLVVSIDAPAGWAFADHLKYQGGGNQGEYAEVLEWKEPADTGEEESYWDIRVKDFFGVDNSDDELVDGLGLNEDSLTQGREHFRICARVRQEWLTRGDEIEEPEELPMDSYWIHKDKLAEAEEDQGGYWLSVDPADESNERPVDIEYVSEDVPGNMKFYD